tara:strand:+ start:319 stop:1182 length:864 start_codon:yes stop_codon:yes gene_type:complete
MGEKKSKKILITTIVVTIVIVIIIWILYQNQYHYIFYPTKLEKDHIFSFEDYDNDFEEMWFQVDSETNIHGLLFKRISDQGIPYVSNTQQTNRKLVFYLHGNSGDLQLWGQIAPLFTYHDHDIFILDYRGYGKSEGRIKSQTQIFNDVKIVYDKMKANYIESNITIVGYSIGTGIASYLASKNSPRALILNAPYYSLTRLIKEAYPIIPNFLVSFKLETYKYNQECDCPIYIFHGTEDEIIPIEHSKDLSNLFTKQEDHFYTLIGIDHININEDRNYHKLLSEILLN